MRRQQESSGRRVDVGSSGGGGGGRHLHPEEGARKRRGESQENPRHSSSSERGHDRHSIKLVPRMTKRLFLYLILFILAQAGLGLICLTYYSNTSLSSLNIQEGKKVPGKSKFVDYPTEYKPPCHIKAKEAHSALSRAATSECKRELADLACKSENDKLYPAVLPNYCTSNSGNGQEKRGTYLGCFRDEFDDRIFQGRFARLADNSRWRCVQFCSESGFKFAGTQYGRECFCESHPPSEEFLLKDDLCDKPCTGDLSQKCGGYLTMNVYETGVEDNKEESEQQLPEVSSKSRVRIVYLLTVNGRAVRQLKRLIKKLFDGRNYFYIHVDARQDYMYRQMKELSERYPEYVRISENRFSTIWGGASLLRMLVSCMYELLSMDDWKWDFVINLSESDYLLKNPEILTDFLSDNREKNFVKSHGRDSQVFVKKQGLDRTFHECDTHMFRVGARNLPEGIIVDGGSDWVCLNRKFVTYIVSGDDDLLRGLRVLFNYTLLPAESFFHTTLKNSEFCSTYVNNNLRMTNWKRHLGCKCQHKAIVDWCGCSPNDFLPDDWHKLNSTRNKDIFFARKFEPVVNQAVLDMVDRDLLRDESSSETEKSYWQNIFHHLDSSPKADPAVVTLGHIFADSSIQVFGLKFEKLLEVTSLHYDDVLEGIILTFMARSEFEDEDQIFEAFIRVKIPESSIDFRSGELTVGTDFDPKELLFRNFFSAIGPLSKPVLTYDFVESLSDRNVSAKIVWSDPIGRIIHTHRIETLNNSAIRESIELKDKSPLLPGIWSVVFIVESTENVATKIPFLVTPLLPVNDELSSEEYLKSLHRVRNYPIENDDLLGSDNILYRQAERNADKLGSDLSNWISELAGSFYQVESVCQGQTSSATVDDDPKLALVPKCVESEWSTFFPDPKSELNLN